MTQLFRQEAIDNKKEKLWGEVILIQPFSFFVITAFVTIVVIAVALMLLYGTYARRENVSGYLLPNKGLVKIYAPQVGTVTNVHVEESTLVNQGDLLLTISTQKTNFKSDDVNTLIINKLKDDKTTIRSKLTEQNRLDDLEKSQYKDQVSGLNREIKQLKNQVKTHKKKFRVSQEQFGRLDELYAKKYLSKSDYITAQEHHVDIQLRLDEVRQQLISKKNQLSNVKNLLTQLPLKSLIKIAEFRQQLSDIDQKILEIEGRRIYTLRTPTAGRVTAIQVSPGTWVKERPLLTILPRNSKFKAELFIPTRAIGFIKKGQSVLLRYTAFPYQRFGLYNGTIDKISEVILTPDELHVPVKIEEPVYRVTVIPDKQAISAYGKEFNLQAGMLLQASIILEGRTLGEWLLAPIYSLRGRL
ncbi:MAG: HlyD family efflux transporter periplasmic adaptor subunit [Methylococcaceae bacterium]|nr:HlyD family efflux transporter periplasmic adaptor subunit [Methylococcaceae bacterium]